MFLINEPTEWDQSWCKKTGEALSARFPAAKAFHLNLHPSDFLRTENSLMKFIFRYNSACLHGEGLLARIEKDGASIPPPSAQLARSRIGWLKRCVANLENGRVPDELFQGAVESEVARLSHTDFLASRKVLRNFVLLEGAYALMLTGDFTSFRCDVVLPRLAKLCPQWQSLIHMTTAVLNDPFAAGVSPQAAIEEAFAVRQVDNH